MCDEGDEDVSYKKGTQIFGKSGNQKQEKTFLESTLKFNMTTAEKKRHCVKELRP